MERWLQLHCGSRAFQLCCCRFPSLSAACCPPACCTLRTTPALQSLQGINTRGPNTVQQAVFGGDSMPGTPMSAGGDIFDGLVTPTTAAAAAGAAGGVAMAAAFHRPDGVPPLNTAALARDGMGRAPAESAQGSAADGELPEGETDLPTGTSYYTAQDGRSTAFPSQSSSAFASGRGALSSRPSDVFDGLPTPAHGASGAQAAAIALGAVAGTAAVAAGAGAARRPGFRMDVNDLAEGSVSGELRRGEPG